MTSPLVTARFVSRPNRFVVRAELPGGEVVDAHLANTGRLTHLTTPGRELLLAPATTPGRKTPYSVVRAWDGTWVALDAAEASGRLATYLEGGKPLGRLGPVAELRQEVALEAHRIDLMGRLGDGRTVWIEVKSSGRVFDGTALLSKTPSTRAASHLAALADRAAAGDAAAVAFVIQRDDARRMVVGGDADPGWIQAVQNAAARGVSVLAFRCTVTPHSVEVIEEIPVVWQPDDPTG